MEISAGTILRVPVFVCRVGAWWFSQLASGLQSGCSWLEASEAMARRFRGAIGVEIAFALEDRIPAIGISFAHMHEWSHCTCLLHETANSRWGRRCRGVYG